MQKMQIASGRPIRLCSLRVCPETSSGIAEFSQHEANGGETQECEPLAIEVLPILGEPAAAVEPGNRALDDPATWKHHKSFGPIGPLDDFSFEMRQDFRERLVEFRPLIAAVGKQLLQEWIHPEQRGKQYDAAVAVLDVGGMNDRVQQQTQRVYENMALLALDLLARIIAMRIDPGPPFSALFTLWLSMMAAVGLASRSPCSRHAT